MWSLLNAPHPRRTQMSEATTERIELDDQLQEFLLEVRAGQALSAGRVGVARSEAGTTNHAGTRTLLRARVRGLTPIEETCR